MDSHRHTQAQPYGNNRPLCWIIVTQDDLGYILPAAGYIYKYLTRPLYAGDNNDNIT